jgi:hypothetical protein
MEDWDKVGEPEKLLYFILSSVHIKENIDH